MFWTLNYQSSEIDNLLNKEDVTLLEILNEDDILQECKAQNKKLIDFVAEEKNIKFLVELIVDEPDSNLDLKLQYKLPVRACEILISNVGCLNEGLVASEANIVKLLSYINTTQLLNPLQASLFAKLFQHLITVCSQQMMERMDGELLGLLMRHIGVSAIMDTILHLATLDFFSQWMISNDFVSKLIERFSPEHSREEAENVCWMLVELMKRWTDVTAPPITSTIHHIAIAIQQESTCLCLLDTMLTGGKEWSIAAGLNFFIHILTPKKTNESAENELTVDGALEALAKRWPQISQLFTKPPQQKYSPMLTTWGILERPVGRVRLLIVQLVAVAIPHNNVSLNNQLQQNGTFATILDLYFEYVWNNLLHQQVQACISAFLIINNQQHIQQLLSNYKLLEKIISIFKENEKRVGVAHLGHLTNISNSLQQHLLLHQDSSDVGLESWNVFVESQLCEINSINESQLISGWVVSNEIFDNGICTNEFNFESDIGPKDGRFLRMFGCVEEGISGSADAFEALIAHKQNDLRMMSDDMFAPSSSANQDHDQHGWANFGEIESSVCDQPDLAEAAPTDDNWADFDISANGEVKQDGTSVDSG